MGYNETIKYINDLVVIRYRIRLSEHYLVGVVEHVGDDYLIANVNDDHFKIDLDHIYEIKDYSYFEEMVIRA